MNQSNRRTDEKAWRSHARHGVCSRAAALPRASNIVSSPYVSDVNSEVSRYHGPLACRFAVRVSRFVPHWSACACRFEALHVLPDNTVVLISRLVSYRIVSYRIVTRLRNKCKRMYCTGPCTGTAMRCPRGGYHGATWAGRESLPT